MSAQEDLRALAERAIAVQLAPAQEDGPASAEPDVADERVREATGRGWDEWVRLIDAWDGRDAGHTAIAAWVGEEFDVEGWWAQCVTVGYERLSGRRLPGQRADGTYTVQRNKTVEFTREHVRSLLLDAGAGERLFPGLVATPRSKPTAKQQRYALVPKGEATSSLGLLGVTADPPEERCRVNVTHDKLPTPAAVEAWREYWARWVEALAAGELPA